MVLDAKDIERDVCDRDLVAFALSTLDKRDRYVLGKRFGFFGNEVSGVDLAKEMGVSHSREWQIETRALRRAKCHLKGIGVYGYG